jgi:uncharacterized iron-regulated protein
LRLAAIVALALALGCAVPSGEKGDWQSRLGLDDPRVGKIWDSAAHHYADREELLRRARTSDFVILGEKHDNADHHRLQGVVIQSLAREGVPPAVAFEMLSPDDLPSLRAWQSTTPEDVEALGHMLNWNHSGWPPFEIYKPVFLAAISRSLRIEPANLSHAQLTALRMNGLDAFSEADQKKLGLVTPLPQTAHDALADEIREGHCGMVDAHGVDAMIDIQRARDATLAEALVRVGVPAVLIAGAGHARKDGAVPFYLAQRLPERHVLSIAFVEVNDHIAESLPDFERSYDFLWFTPRVDDLDPCERFKEQLEKMKHPTPSEGKSAALD